MLRLSTLVLTLFLSVSAFAHKGGDLSNLNVLVHLDDLGDEIEGYNHRPKAMSRVYEHLRVSARIAKVSKTYIKPAVVTDATLMVMISDIAARIQGNTVQKLGRYRILNRLHISLSRLKGGRINLPPVLLGELEISGADPYSFGATLAGFPSQTEFVVTNVGDGAVTNITPMPFEGAFDYYATAYPGQSGTCGASLAEGESCVINVQFNGPIMPGFYEGQLVIDYNDGVSVQTLSKGLQGTSI